VGCIVCVIHIKLFDLINVIENNHLHMSNYDYNVTFDDVIVIKY
jgi:hypothetical protein